MKRLISNGLLGLACALLMIVKSEAAPDLVWFCPSDPSHYPSDYMNLFTTEGSTQWTAARGHVQVFKMYATLMPLKTDEELRTIFAYLKSHQMMLGIELAALTNSATDNSGHGVEGYMSAGVAVAIVQRIKDLGGELAYIAMDEPLYFGHFYTGTNGAQDSIQNLAVNAAANLQAILRIFPNVKIGDIEPVDAMPSGEWSAAVQQWLAAYATTMGRPLDFFHADILWTTSWRSTVPALSQLLVSGGNISLGVIFNSTTAGTCTAGWVESAQVNIQSYNASGIVQPKQVIFQSWNPYPDQMLPETNLTTFTSLIDYYFGAYALKAPPAPFYRLYNPSWQRHFYTANSTEASNLQQSGWRLEGSAGALYTSVNNAANLQPLYRLYKSSTKDHLYTASSSEVVQAQTDGYVSEGVAGYLFKEVSWGGAPLYHAYSATGGSFYTNSQSEYDSLSTAVWTKLGMSGYTP